MRHWAKYRDRSSRTSSGSRASDSDVNATRSPKSTLVTRRSATGGPLAGPAPAAVPVRRVPHSAQNLPPEAAAPHTGQPAAAWGAPHALQNFAPGLTAASHAGQVAAISGTVAPGPHPPRVLSMINSGRRVRTGAGPWPGG